MAKLRKIIFYILGILTEKKIVCMVKLSQSNKIKVLQNQASQLSSPTIPLQINLKLLRRSDKRKLTHLNKLYIG